MPAPQIIPLTSGPERDDKEPKEGVGLCLSGGGYRAMLFHLGTVWYLHDAGLLPRLARVSSVSGGSITAGVLALRWAEVAAGGSEAFRARVVDPVRQMASTSVDVASVLRGVLLPGSVSDRVIARYRDVLFGRHTLQDLPDHPRFVINASNVQTGSLFRFSKPYIADWQIGRELNPTLPLAAAVAASSAFPPALSPVWLSFGDGAFAADPGPLNRPEYTAKVCLTDGGVYDNMGIETAWKRCRTLFVSDAGQKMQPDPEPNGDWARHSLRVNGSMDNQVRSLRKRQLVAAFQAKVREGAYWGMWTDPAEYSARSALALPADRAGELARVPTRLKALPAALQERLINFGYGMAERALRSFYTPAPMEAARFPYSRGI